MSSFNESLKGLQRTFARQATNADLQQSGSLIDPLKYTKRKPARALGYVNYTFGLPAVANLWTPNDHLCYVIYQQDFSAPFDFRILNQPAFKAAFDGNDYVLAIRYRIGNTSYRYALNSTVNNINIPAYTNQLIKKNFVIEYWKTDATGYHNFPAFTFITSQLALPTTSDQTSIDLGLQATQVGIASLSVQFLPDTVYFTGGAGGYVPMNQLGYWLDNQ